MTEEVLKYRITQIAYQAELLQNDALRIFLRSKHDSRWRNCETDEELRGVLWSLKTFFEDAGISYEDELSVVPRARFQVQPTDGDGNCMYHGLAWLLNRYMRSQRFSHASVRQGRG